MLWMRFLIEKQDRCASTNILVRKLGEKICIKGMSYCQPRGSMVRSEAENSVKGKATKVQVKTAKMLN